MYQNFNPSDQINYKIESTTVRFLIYLQIQEEREKRMAEAAMLETHIMQAQARAMSADERELNRVTNRMASFPDLGLPPCKYMCYIISHTYI